MFQNLMIFGILIILLMAGLSLYNRDNWFGGTPATAGVVADT
jgi:hypothetical protein